MNAPLWGGTPFESFAAQLWACPTHRLAYFMGQIDQTVFEVFGIPPEGEPAPQEARQVAMVMMAALLKKRDEPEAVREAGRLIAAWRERRSVN